MRRLLEDAGVPLRLLARRLEGLESKVAPGTELHRGDVLDPATLIGALQGIHTAYYLVHSMGSDQDFEQQDRIGAQNFAEAARAAGVQRIIYLGGLAHGDDLSPHLRSRHEVGACLRSTGVPVIELRASVVLGSGSLSFEMLRALVERLPVMICPKWVRVPAQPISVEVLLEYLMESLTLPGTKNRTYEIGGKEAISYGQLMKEYARQRGLRRWMISVPVLTPRLSSLWLGLVTPIYARVGRKLIESIKHPSVVRDTRALQDFSVRPLGHQEAIAAALRNEEREIAESRWFDAFSSGGDAKTWAGVRFGNRLVDSRSLAVRAPANVAFRPIQRIGGATGWYACNWLWKIRGFLDLLVGGVGVRRGRPHPNQINVGDALDFWRVEAYEPGRLLRLHAEMKLPGRAWLEFEVQPTPEGSIVRQTALYDPVGLWGLMYWYSVFPLHAIVFGGMLRKMGRIAESEALSGVPSGQSPSWR